MKHNQIKTFFNKLRAGFSPAPKTVLNEVNHHWDSYNDAAVGRPLYYLYHQALLALPSPHNNLQALELGAGAGDIVMSLLEKGFEVTAVDSSHRSEEIIRERVKHFDNKLHFQRIDFLNFETEKSFDLIVSLFALPFLSKDELPPLIARLCQSMNKGAIFAFNLFAENHTWVKSGLAASIGKEELIRLLQDNNLKIDFFLNRIYEQPGNAGADNTCLVHWDIYDVIGLKIN